MGKNTLDGTVYWITGLSGAGKTTIGNAMYYKLKELHKNVVLLDGDILKQIVGDDLGYSKDDRKKRAYRYSGICKMLADQGIITIICTIAMYDEVRKWNRDNIGKYVEVFLDVSLELLQERDQKGMYSAYKNGDFKNLVGLDLEVELPKTPDLIFNNDGTLSINKIVEKILEFQIDNLDNFDRDTEYWNEFYKNKKVHMEPTPFAKDMLAHMTSEGSIIEIGCGNGRDSVFFAENGLNVIAIDAAKYAIESLKNEYSSDNILFVCDDFVKSKTLFQRQYDYCYSRFTIHAINYKQEMALIQNVRQALKSGGKFFIEVRGIHDTLYGKGKKVGRNEYIYNDHYRRFIVCEELKEDLEKNGFIIKYAEEKEGFAPYKNEDPKVIRVIAEKV